MGVFQNVSNALTGTVGDDEYSKAPQLQGPQSSAYQIPGLQQTNTQLQGFSDAMPATPDLMGATQNSMQGQTALRDYLSQVATGQRGTAADQMFSQGQQAGARNLQSGMVSAQGMSPALAMRQLFNSQATQNAQLAGQSATQKLQEQQAYSSLAQSANQNLYQMQYQNAEQGFNNAMQRNRAQTDIANSIFSNNRAQTSFNTQLDQNRQAFSAMQRQDYLQHAQDQARSRAAMIHGIVSGVGTVAGAGLGMALGGPVGAAVGGSLGGNLLGGFAPGGGQGGSGGGYDPAMMAMLMNRSQNQGQVPGYPGSDQESGYATDADFMGPPTSMMGG